jgi:8-oxo-dGTP pyrophosphatase MutT (NUDIX family)
MVIKAEPGGASWTDWPVALRDRDAQTLAAFDLSHADKLNAVMVEQYRHGAEGQFLEFPGGQIDPGDISLETAARRELSEETGYEVSSLRYLGAHYPNPGAQTNRIHTYLATVVEHGEGPELDVFENLRVVLLTRAELAQRIRDGVEVASTTLAALSLLSLLAEPDAHPASAAG